MKIASRSEMQEMDRYASRELHIPEEILMENAAHAAVSTLAAQGGEIRGGNFLVICGVGNNGGDGLAMARHLLSHGGKVSVFVLGEAAKFRGSAKLNWEIAAKLGIDLKALNQPEDILPDLMQAQVVIDALFGTGLDREISGLARQVIETVNKAGRRVLSLDLPSGINADTGEVMGAAIRADWTVTFGLPKRGNILYPGYEYCGKLFCTPISFPPWLRDQEEIKVALNAHIAIPPRRRMAHKGSQGNCLVIAGSRSYHGAPLFCALSFLKAGGGYVRLALPESLLVTIAPSGAELVFAPQKETAAGSIARANLAELLSLADKADSVIIGPGLSLDPETAELVRNLVCAIEKPLIIDGDGLSALVPGKEALRSRKIPAVLTPHLGEMSRLLGQPREKWERNKIPVLQQFCAAWQSIIVLKGPHSLIGYPDGRVFINLSGNPGMATAGAGDVLPGCIAAMSGLGLRWEEAARKGVYIHGAAGDLAAAERGEDGMTARDILEALPQALKLDREGFLDRKYRVEAAL